MSTARASARPLGPVLDRDVDAIIGTHARDRAVPRWLHDTAESLAEIDRPDLAIDWAEQATDHGNGYESLQAADYWCALLGQHRPDQVLAARWEVFDRWPTSSTASHLHHDAGADWPPYRNQVLDRLASHTTTGLSSRTNIGTPAATCVGCARRTVG